MTREKKPSGRLNKGPFTADDIIAGLIRLGAVRVPSKEHSKCFELPNGKKFPVSTAWTSVRAGDPIFNGMIRTTGYSKKQLLQALNGRES